MIDMLYMPQERTLTPLILLENGLAALRTCAERRNVRQCDQALQALEGRYAYGLQERKPTARHRGSRRSFIAVRVDFIEANRGSTPILDLWVSLRCFDGYQRLPGRIVHQLDLHDSSVQNTFDCLRGLDECSLQAYA